MKPQSDLIKQQSDLIKGRSDLIKRWSRLNKSLGRFVSRKIPPYVLYYKERDKWALKAEVSQ